MKYTKNEDSSHTLSFFIKNSFNFLKFWKYSFTYITLGVWLHNLISVHWIFINRFFTKLFNTGNIDMVKQCQIEFGCQLPSDVTPTETKTKIFTQNK